jgi:anti-anti-sigma factor
MPQPGAVSVDQAPPPRQRSRAALTVSITDRGPGVVVSVAGEAGTDNLQTLEFALIRLVARRPALVVLDFSELTLLSSLAIGMLIGLRRDLARWQGRVKLACVGPRIQETLDVARLTDLFEVHATVEEAFAVTTPSHPQDKGQ